MRVIIQAATSFMPVRPNLSAGLLLFSRAARDEIEIFLAHPGGPFWAKRDAGAWTIPKGVPHEGEELLGTAQREFHEETGILLHGPFIELGSVRQKAGKIVHAWACEGDADPATVSSNSMPFEWPPRSGRWITVPEIDRCEWFDLAAGRVRINVAQEAFIDRLVQRLRDGQLDEDHDPAEQNHSRSSLS
jgi:predicted NUDIX family NTP pyrophosphohydrolase